MSEEDIDQEEYSIDDGQWSLGHGESTRLRLEGTVPLLYDHYSADDKQHATDKADEGVNVLS